MLTERGLGGDSVDLDARLDQFRRDRSQRASSARSLAQRWASQVAAYRAASRARTDRRPPASCSPSPFPTASRAIAAMAASCSPMAAAPRSSRPRRWRARPIIAVAELTGTAASGRILLAAPITQAEIERASPIRSRPRDEISFDRGAMALRARRRKTLHAITLSEAPLALSPSAETARVLADGLVAAGLDKLPWSKPAKQWRDRVMFLRKAEGEAGPICPTLRWRRQREDWLVPALYDKTSLKDFSAGDLSDALMTLLPWELRARLEREAPTHFEAPTGTMLAIDYEAEQGPTIAVRLQELFGLNTHPSIAKGAVPLVLELLSPAHRPVQVTRDLPGFWRGSYAAVRSDLRGRYPRHPWPEDPASALPTGGSSRGGREAACSLTPVERAKCIPLTLRSSFSPKWRLRGRRLVAALAAGVVISSVWSVECGVMRNLMIFAAVLVGLGTCHGADGGQDDAGARAPPAPCARTRPPPRPSRRPASAASAFPATPAAISRPTAASTASASTSWSTPAPRWWR